MAVVKAYEISCDVDGCGGAERFRVKQEKDAIEESKKIGWRHIKGHQICPTCIERIESARQLQENGT